MKVIVTQPVQIALRTLDADDRQQVQAWFKHLENWENDPIVRDHSQKLNTPEGVYVLKMNSDLRIFFTIVEETITILDIARRSTILRVGRAESS